jgi:hypothetical protein
MHTTPLRLAIPCTTNHPASKRRAAVWRALLSVLILSAAVVAPAEAAPPGGETFDEMLQRCARLHTDVYSAYINAGASVATATAEADRANQLCRERSGRKKKL